MAEVESLIVVKQLPLIEERLRDFRERIELEVSNAEKLVCTEDTLAAVKKARAALNTEYSQLEAARIDVKKRILTPYEEFSVVYNECVSEPFTRGIKALSTRIDDVESELKSKKEATIQAYFRELCASHSIDWLEFSRLGIKVVRSVSDKKYKEMVSAEVERIASDISLISTQEHADEIMVEYKISLNCNAAIILVKNRHAALAREKELAEKARREAEQKAAAAKAVEKAIEEEQDSAPVTVPETILPNIEDASEVNAAPEPVHIQPELVPEEAKLYVVSFKTKPLPREKITELKQYLISGGYIDG